MNAVILVVVVILATYVSALVLSLMQVRRAALESRLAPSNREHAAAWLFEHAASIQLAVSLLRTILRLGVFGLVLIEIAGVGESANLTYATLALAGGVTVTLLWVTTTVLASALARHAAAGLVASGLPLLRLIDLVCLPLTKGLSFVDEAVRRLTGARLREAEELAEEELLRSIGETQREGALDERSAEMLENVVEFSTTDVDEVMTPRTDIDGIELSDDLAAIRTLIVRVGHSRIPVYEGDLDHIVGVLYVKDLVPYLGEDASGFKLKPLLRQPIVVPETKQVRELLGEFQRSEVHMAIVIDEYGGTAGLITIEDVLEEIVGEIQDEHDPDDEEPPALDRLDDTRLEVDGRFHIDDLNTQLGLALPEDGEFDTVAGFVLASLGRVPAVGESFERDSARFTTLAATPTHVQRVGIELLVGERQDA